MFRAFVGLLAALLLGCSSDDSKPASTQAECEAIANDIRRAAVQRGISPTGVCSSTNEQIQKDFGEACRRLKDCNDRCCQ